MKKAVGNARSLPDGVQVFLFGSACYRNNPNDIDMLFVYDSSLIPPKSAYPAFRPIITEIEKMVGISVRSVVLSQDEARETGFIDEIEPIQLSTTPMGN